MHENQLISTTSKSQGFIERYLKILKYHGLKNGFRRALDQWTQIDMYDLKNGINTRDILGGSDFQASVDQAGASEVMHYQPVYTAAVKLPLQFLVKNFPIVGASSTCFIDLGCGRGKALHVARSVMQHVSLVGVDLNFELLMSAWNNLGCNNNLNKPSDAHFRDKLNQVDFYNFNVNDVNYLSILKPFDVVIVFNKNSFDRNTTKGTLAAIAEATKDKDVFYIYNNPVFESSFGQFDCIFTMDNWHKNWRTKVFQIQASN